MTLFKNILLAFTVIAVFALHPSLNKGKTPITFLQYLVYGNSIKLAHNSPINKNKISVKWECEQQNVDCKELSIIEDGKQINNIPFEKGNQHLVVYYDGINIGTLHQNKLARNQSHQYLIKLTLESNQLTFDGNISGPSPGSELQVIYLDKNTIASL